MWSFLFNTCTFHQDVLYLKNKYPNVKLYGAEINPSAASIASHVAQVQVANIEEKSLDYGEIKFDYIIFGDVLEHLRDPKATIEYCKGLLKENGKILRIRNEGVEILGSAGRKGDLYLQFIIDVPAKSSKEEKALLEKLRELRGENKQPQPKKLSEIPFD